MFNNVRFDNQRRPAPDELLGFYDRQGHEITHSGDKLQRMIERTSCFVTAWDGSELIGLARGVTDGVWGCLVECKLDPAYQGPACVTRQDGRIEHDSQGIAREMARMVIEELRSLGAERIAALAYGTEEDFCLELGFQRLRGVVAMELGAGSAVRSRDGAPSVVAS